MSQYIVSARKYRPLQFADVVGQEHVTRTLQNAIAKDQVAHAFLFCGPRGIGKTTCARVLAKVLNCTDRGDALEPCNTCASCSSFNNQASFNIIELDGASNNKVENIRTLIDQVRIPPQEGRYKVFIIDEVHMLSTSAFNAFLKTLEEPPPYAIFILATTEKHKLLPTILSRCQIFDFKRIDVPQIISHLQHICAEENITADHDALHLVARKADGALRDALSIFDRVASYSGGEIKYAQALENLRELGADYYFRAVDYCLLGDLPALMSLLDEIIMLGFEPILFIQGLAEHMRNLLMCRDEKTIPLLQVSESMSQRYHDQARATPYSFIIGTMDALNVADMQYPRASHKRLHVETTLCRLVYLSQAADMDASRGPALVGEAAGQKKKSEPDLKPLKTEPDRGQTPDVKTAIPSPPVEKVEPVKEKIPVASVASKTSSAPETKKPKRSILSLSSNGDKGFGLASFVNVVQEEQTKQIEKPEFTLDVVQKFWTEYTESVPSPSLKQVLTAAELNLTGESKITIHVVGKVAKSSVQLEKKLLMSLRDYLQIKDLKYEYIVTEVEQVDEQVDKPIHLMNATEKYKLLIDNYPEVDELRRTFDLQIDSSYQKK